MLAGAQTSLEEDSARRTTVALTTCAFNYITRGGYLAERKGGGDKKAGELAEEKRRGGRGAFCRYDAGL